MPKPKQAPVVVTVEEYGEVRLTRYADGTFDLRTHLVRDLMQARYLFGAAADDPLVTDLPTALHKAQVGESFYFWPGGERLYHVALWFYQVKGIMPQAVLEQLRQVLPVPEAPGL